MGGILLLLLGLISLFFGLAILFNTSARKFAGNWYFSHLDSQDEREKEVLICRVPIFLVIGFASIVLPFAIPPEPQSLVLDQRCEWYRAFIDEAKAMTPDELNAAMDSLTNEAGSSGKAWAKFSAYFRVYNESMGMHGSTEWDDCPK